MLRCVKNIFPKAGYDRGNPRWIIKIGKSKLDSFDEKCRASKKNVRNRQIKHSRSTVLNTIFL
jgi:hypothetical protein